MLDAIKKIVEPLGIKKVELRAESNPTLDKVDIDIGETAWNALIHCANSAGLHAWFDPAGTLIVGGADYSTPPVATLCCAKNGKRKPNYRRVAKLFRNHVFGATARAKR